MQKSNKSVKRLDKHQTDCNGLSNRVYKTTKIIKEIRPNTKDITNIAETYRNKMIEIDRELENKSIDFWDGDFELRKAIEFYLKEKLGIGLSNILHVASQVTSIETDQNMTKTTRKRKFRYVRKAIFNLNEANRYISSYTIEDNINETLLTYFLNTEYKTNFFQSYSKMKKNIQEIGLENTYIDSEIIKILEYRKEKLSDYNVKDLLENLYPDLEQEEESVRKRTL